MPTLATMKGKIFIELKRNSVLVPETVGIEVNLVLLILMVSMRISSIMSSSWVETANKEIWVTTKVKTNLNSSIMWWSHHLLEVLQLIDLPSYHPLFKRIHQSFQKELVLGLMVDNLTPYLDHNHRAFWNHSIEHQEILEDK